MPEPSAVPDIDGAALVASATDASKLLWLGVGDAAPRPVWHVWDGAAAYVVHAHDTADGPGREQQVPGLAEASAAQVAVRGDKGARVVTWSAQVHHLEPGTEAWDAALALMAGSRLNEPDTDGQAARWARECGIAVLTPAPGPGDGPELVEAPGSYRTDGGAATVPASPATTVTAKPYVLGRRARRRPRL